MKQGRFVGFSIAVFLGVGSYYVNRVTQSPFADPLLVALIAGICIRSFVVQKKELTSAVSTLPNILIPIGVAFYGAKNLNFMKYETIDIKVILLILATALSYIFGILLLGKLLKMKNTVTYLTATGSAICGASAITIAAPAIDADADDVSVSLVAVAVSGFIGLFIVLPFIAIQLDMTNKMYGIFAAAVLQFTGFVKAAVTQQPFLTEEINPQKIISLSMSIKAMRYLGLLVAIPLFASLNRKRIFIPWYLWMFVLAGCAGSWLYVNNTSLYVEKIIPIITPIYTVSWSVALAAVGLNADIKQLLNIRGTQTLFMALAGFALAVTVFLTGVFIIL